MQTEYRYFKSKTNKRLAKLENKPKTNLKPIYTTLSNDSILINKAFLRLDFLKSLH